MNLRGRIVFLLIVLVAPYTSFGQPAEKVQPGEVDRARLDDLRERGYEALYNLDYEGARRKFKEMAQLFPDHPVGPQCLAASLWLQELNRSRHLQASLYSAESFYAKTEGKADPRMVEQFREWTRTATQLAEARLRRNPDDVEALYFLGATEGLKAIFAAAVERRFIAALNDGSSAANRHRKVLKLDPNFRDAELTIGMHDYIVGSLPVPVKVLASVGGVRGSKKRGLETLERVARNGRWARDIARVLLIDLYKREKRWAEAVTLGRELAARYPRNYLFRLQTADALVARAVSPRQAKDASGSTTDADLQQAFGIFESLLHGRGSRDAAAPARAAPDLIHFRYGEALLAAEQPVRAAQEFLAAAKLTGAEPELATMARLRAAQSLDLAGRRGEAVVEYRAVLNRPNINHAHEEARRGLRRAISKTDLDPK